MSDSTSPDSPGFRLSEEIRDCIGVIGVGIPMACIGKRSNDKKIGSCTEGRRLCGGDDDSDQGVS